MSKRIINIIPLILFAGCLLNGNLYGQKISANVNRTRIFIGEQIILKLSVEQTQPGIQWFQFPDTLNHLEIVTRSKIDTVSAGGFLNFSQTVSITSFDSGRWQFPALAVAGINQITMPINIDVVPVDVSKKKDYNDIKDIEEVLLAIKKLQSSLPNVQAEKKFLRSADVKKLLNISDGTLQRLRISGTLIANSNVGIKISI